MFKLCLLAVLLVGCNGLKSKKDPVEFRPVTTLGETDIKDEMTGNIKVDLESEKKGRTIDREFYGSQLSPWTSFPGDALVSSMGLGTVRIGGNLYDTYNWENEMTWVARGQFKKLDSYEESIKRVKAYGAEPIMQVNLMGPQPIYANGRYKMTNSADAESAARFIDRVNGQLKLDLKHVCLGNEFDQWADTHAPNWESGEPMSADDYIDRFIAYALAIRTAQARVSGNPNDIKIWGPEIANSFADWQSGNMKKDCQWTSTPGVIECSYGGGAFDHFLPYFFDRLRRAEADSSVNPKGYKLLDYFSFHYYPTFRTKVSDPDSIIVDSQGRQMVNEMLESLQAFHNSDYVNVYDRGFYMNFKPNLLKRMKGWRDQYYPNAKMALSEFAVDSLDTTPNYHPIVRPLYMADLIGIAANEGVDNFNLSFLNTYTPKPIPWSIFEDDKPTNLGNMYNLFTKHFKGKVLEVQDSFGDKVNAYATVDGDIISLLVVNKSANTRLIKVDLDQKSRLLSKFEQVVQPWSTTLYKIPRSKPSFDNISVAQFGAKEMGITIDPHYQ